jgi:hypothetical protein
MDIFIWKFFAKVLKVGEVNSLTFTIKKQLAALISLPEEADKPDHQRGKII